MEGRSVANDFKNVTHCEDFCKLTGESKSIFTEFKESLESLKPHIKQHNPTL